MKLKRSHSSMLVLVMMVLTALNLLALASWQAMSLGYDVVIQREKMVKRFYRAEILFDMGIVLVKNNFTAFVKAVDKQSVPMAIDLTQAVQEVCGAKSKIIEGYVFVCKPNVKEITDTLHIKAILKECDSAPFMMQCWLQRVPKILEDGKKGYVFVVEYFTFGVVV